MKECQTLNMTLLNSHCQISFYGINNIMPPEIYFDNCCFYICLRFDCSCNSVTQRRSEKAYLYMSRRIFMNLNLCYWMFTELPLYFLCTFMYAVIYLNLGTSSSPVHIKVTDQFCPFLLPHLHFFYYPCMMACFIICRCFANIILHAPPQEEI